MTSGPWTAARIDLNDGSTRVLARSSFPALLQDDWLFTLSWPNSTESWYVPRITRISLRDPTDERIVREAVVRDRPITSVDRPLAATEHELFVGYLRRLPL